MMRRNRLPGRKKRFSLPSMQQLRIVGSVFAVGMGLFFASVGAQRVMAAPLFRVQEVRWFGLSHLNETKMQEQFGWVLGANLFDLNLSDISTELLSDPWIKTVAVRKEFPSRVNITVTERAPAVVELRSEDPLDAKGCGPCERVFLDAEGVVLEDEGSRAYDLPRVVHFTSSAYQRALPLMALVGRRSFSYVDLAEPTALSVYLPEGVLHFGGDGFSEKWQRFVKIEGDIRRRHLIPWEIDLRFSDQVVVKGGAVTGGDRPVPDRGARDAKAGNSY